MVINSFHVYRPFDSGVVSAWIDTTDGMQRGKLLSQNSIPTEEEHVHNPIKLSLPQK